MAGYSPNQFFQGELANKQLRDYIKLDTTKQSLKDRKEVIEKLLEGHTNYFVEYFSNYFKVNINASDATSENVNVCKTLEYMANYLLNSEESKQMDFEQHETYVFHTRTEQLAHKIRRESFSIPTENGSENLVDNPNIIHSIIKKQGNARLPKRQKITTQDLNEDSFCGSVLREYQKMLDNINSKLKEKPDRLWRYYSNNKSSVQKDMLDAKDMLKGVWGYNTQVKEGHVPDMDIFDFTDFETIKFMLTMNEPSFAFDFEMWLTWKEFDDTVRKSNLTEEELIVVYCLRNSWQLKEISEEFNLEYNRLRRTTINNIVKKISKVGNKYDAEDFKVRMKIAKRRAIVFEDEQELKEIELMEEYHGTKVQ